MTGPISACEVEEAMALIMKLVRAGSFNDEIADFYKFAQYILEVHYYVYVYSWMKMVCLVWAVVLRTSPLLKLIGATRFYYRKK